MGIGLVIADLIFLKELLLYVGVLLKAKGLNVLKTPIIVKFKISSSLLRHAEERST